MKKIIIITVVILIFVVSVEFSYRFGLSRNEYFEATKYMVTVKMQNECINKSDFNCAKKVNSVMALAVAGQLKRLDKSGVGEGDKEAIKEFLVWQKELEKKIESEQR